MEHRPKRPQLCNSSRQGSQRLFWKASHRAHRGVKTLDGSSFFVSSYGPLPLTPACERPAVPPWRSVRPISFPSQSQECKNRSLFRARMDAANKAPPLPLTATLLPRPQTCCMLKRRRTNTDSPRGEGRGGRGRERERERERKRCGGWRKDANYGFCIYWQLLYH